VKAPVAVTIPDPTAWRIAKRLAAGDVRRLRVQDNGSVLVANQPRNEDTGRMS
jgi:hypothetical protein